jgi:hypothetical protein
MSVATRLFDLNIEKILEGWELCHAALAKDRWGHP